MTQKMQILACSLALIALAALKCASSQDILRRVHQHEQHRQPSNNQASNIPSDLVAQLANIQLPPQLASLTPQQLHQLAQLRELQIQQQQQQAAAKLAAESQVSRSQPTFQPEAAAGNTDSLGTQIPQPNSAASTTNNPNNNGNDQATRVLEELDSAYKELNGEPEQPTPAAPTGTSPASSQSAAASGSEPSGAAPAPTFEVNWNKCPQLEPSESEKGKKTQVITKCLQSAPIPTNLTRENVENHREQIATCALKMEGWFDDSGSYKYEKAEAEIRSKKLEPQIENQVLKFHVACKNEASNKFPRDQNKLIEQVQFYQACMDYYISIVCEIEVSVDQ